MKKPIIPWFKSGDVGGLAYALAGNIVNYIIVIATLKGVLGWPDEIVFNKVIPGMSIGLMAQGIYYAFMAYRLAKKENRSDVTAMPSGISTPAMFVFLYGIITPLHYAIGDPEKVWMAAAAACFLGGAIECLGGFIGPFMRKVIPRAALLGTVAGISFIWMANKGLFDVYADPILGLPVLLLAIIGLIGGYMFPGKIPPLAVAVVGGIIYAFALGRITPDFSGFGFSLSNPISNINAIIHGFELIVPYLVVIIPIEIYNFIETMDNVESAIVAGDNYNVGEAQFADGIATMTSALFGGCIPNTVWSGHAGLKKTGAGAGYSWISGIILGAAGVFGVFGFINSIMPPVIAAITFLWCAIIMVVQAFKATPIKYGAAVVMALIPHVADYAYTEVTGALGALGDNAIWTELSARGFMEFDSGITQALINNGVMWPGVVELKAGAILTGMIWAAATVFIIDKRLDKAAITFGIATVLSLIGFMHSAQMTFNITSPFVIGYFIMTIMCIVFHLLKKWIKAPEDFEYV